MYNNVLSSTAFGEAAIAVNKSRVKLYGNQVYLQPKQQFQIELYNPTQTTKLAKISINGKLLSTAGLVVKPGQRLYLERFIDTAQKFLFNTYTVENTTETKQAIALNGDILVDFYDEVLPEPTRNYLLNDITNWDTGSTYYNKSIGTTFTTGVSSYSPAKLASNTLHRSSAGGASANSIETGRVEQGDYSSQKFKTYNGSFNSYVCNTVHIKLLPISQQPQEIQQLATYCTNCGIRNKKNNYKYCPKCGTKF